MIRIHLIGLVVLWITGSRPATAQYHPVTGEGSAGTRQVDPLMVHPHSHGDTMIGSVGPTMSVGPINADANCHPGGQCNLPTCPGCKKCMMGVDCRTSCGAEARWQDMRPMRFAPYGPGGYAGPARLPHVREYQLRPGDEINVFYLITRKQVGGAYQLAPGDEVTLESIVHEDLNQGTLERGLQVQPDGTIVVRMLGEVQAGGLTIRQLRELLNEEYEQFYDRPSVDVKPVRTNTLAEDIRSAVAGQGGFNQQATVLTVMPDGNIHLPKLGAVCAQGLTLLQLKRELNLRYAREVVGLEVEPILVQQAPHVIHVMGQVATPSRIQIDTPTTVLGAIAAAGGHLPGGNMRQVVVFRRAQDWRLVSTILDLNGAVRGKRPTPSDEIFVQDGDVIIVPDKPIQIFDNWVRQVFIEGVYGIVPFGGISYAFQDNN